MCSVYGEAQDSPLISLTSWGKKLFRILLVLLQNAGSIFSLGEQKAEDVMGGMEWVACPDGGGSAAAADDGIAPSVQGRGAPMTVCSRWVKKSVDPVACAVVHL